jgi:hypothetical protein
MKMPNNMIIKFVKWMMESYSWNGKYWSKIVPDDEIYKTKELLEIFIQKNITETRYEVDGYYCITPCPHGKSCKVNTSDCHRCENFVDISKENQVVYCNIIKKP